MFEKCIRYDRSFIPAYLGLSKLKTGIEAGLLLKRASEVNEENHLVRLEMADWLYSNRKCGIEEEKKKLCVYAVKAENPVLFFSPLDLYTGALRFYASAIRHENSFQLSFVTGALRALRSLGHKERMHQLILR